MNPMQLVKDNLFLIVLILVLAVAYFALRNRPSELASLEEFNSIISGGQPVVVEFYSNA